MASAWRLLVDANGNPWNGNMGDITLRQLLSFTSGISGDDTASENVLITLKAAVNQIYADDAATASTPGSYFYYGNTHLRIAARMAEVATGKTWAQIFAEQLHDPWGWASTSVYSGGGPTPADPVIRYSSTGTFGWAPWVAADSVYGGVIMTQQPTQGDTVPSENLKNQLDPLIRTALAQNPPVIRTVP
jgi:CubicO group peptidase (beta-lactamase class C family)